MVDWRDSQKRPPFREVFVVEVEPRLPSHGDKSCSSQLQLTASASLTGTAGLWKDVKSDDTASLVIDFGCRHVRFQVATDTRAEPSAKWVCQRSAYDVLLTAANCRDCLPLKRKEGNAKERLLNDFLHHIEENGMGSSSFDIVDGEGNCIAQASVNALWAWIHTGRRVSECTSRHDLSAIPVHWRQVLTRSLPRGILTDSHPGGQHFWQCCFRF